MTLSRSEIFKDNYPLLRSCPALNEIRLAKEIKDLTIEVKDAAPLQVHRIILASRIPALRASLIDPCKDGNLVLRWPTVPLSIATAFVQYVYTGEVEMTQANVRGMIWIARMVRLSHLEYYGARFLANSWDFARSWNIDLLMETCLSLMKAQFQSFVHTDHFVRLPADTVLSLIRSHTLAVDSEEQVFAAIVTWVGPDADAATTAAASERLQLHAPEMLKEVRWLQTTDRFRRHLVEQWIVAADNDKPPCPFNRNSRQATRLFVFGRDRDEEKNRWCVLDFDSELRWGERSADMEERWGAAYSVVGERIFVIGGWTLQQGVFRTVKDFLVGERRWRQRAPLAIGRLAPASAVVKVAAASRSAGEKVLIGAFGGATVEGNTWKRLSSCEVYDVSSDRWFKLPNLREERSGAAAASLPGDSRIFVFGGWNGSCQHLASVEYCQLGADWEERATSTSTDDFWQLAAPMRTARLGLAATHFRGRIIVAGGYDRKALNVVEVFTPPDVRSPLGQWTELAGMQQPRWGFTLLSSADAVFALGEEACSIAL